MPKGSWGIAKSSTGEIHRKQKKFEFRIRNQKYKPRQQKQQRGITFNVSNYSASKVAPCSSTCSHIMENLFKTFKLILFSPNFRCSVRFSFRFVPFEMAAPAEISSSHFSPPIISGFICLESGLWTVGLDCWPAFCRSPCQSEPAIKTTQLHTSFGRTSPSLYLYLYT